MILVHQLFEIIPVSESLYSQEVIKLLAESGHAGVPKQWDQTLYKCKNKT